MKKLIWLLPVMALFIVGCASSPEIRTVEKIVTKKVIEKKLPLSIHAPVPLELTEVEWVIVTRENIDEVWAAIEADNEGVALFALTSRRVRELGPKYSRD